MRFFRKRPSLFKADTILTVCCGFGLGGQGRTADSGSGLLRFPSMFSFHSQAKDPGKPEVGECSRLEKVRLLQQGVLSATACT